MQALLRGCSYASMCVCEREGGGVRDPQSADLEGRDRKLDYSRQRLLEDRELTLIVTIYR